MPTTTRAVCAAALGLLSLTVPARGAVPSARATRVARFDALRDTLGRLRGPGDAPDCGTSTGPLGDPAPLRRCGESAFAESAAQQGGGTATATSVTEEALVPTPSGFLSLAELPGTGGGYVRVYGNGDVAADDAAGRTVWSHSGRWFIAQAGGLPNPSIAPQITLGADPMQPMTLVGDDPYAVADLTGDGVADVAVAVVVRPGTRLPSQRSALVSVLDGATGDVVWNNLYPGYVAHLAVAGDVLVVANETGDFTGMWGENGTVSALDGIRFTPARHQLTVAHAWTVPAAGWARWLAIAPAGDGTVAAAWTTVAPGSGSGPRAHLAAVRTGTGEIAWGATTSGYPRALRYDASRAAVVALEQDDPVASQHLGYGLLARSLATGAVTATVRTTDAIALAFRAGDVAGTGSDQWVVSDATVPPTEQCVTVTDVPVCTGNGKILGGRVRALDPATGSALWTQSRGPESDTVASTRSAPQPFGLVLAQRADKAVVVVGSFAAHPEDMDLQALDGASGTVLWSRSGANLLLPLFLAPYQGRAVLAAPSRINVYGAGVQYAADGVESGPVAVAEPYQVVSAYALADGAETSRNPALGDVYAAVRVKADRDRTADLVVGGESGAVFALDGERLGEIPRVLWRTDVPGQVRHLDVADLDGDGRDEVVAVAAHGVDVLDARTGQVRYALPYPDDLVFSATVADVDGDHLPDVVVPGRGLAAYRGRDGARLWQYAPGGPLAVAYFGTSAVTAERVVVSQYVLDYASTGAVAYGGNENAVALSGATGTPLWEHAVTGSNAAPDLWQGVVAGVLPGVAGTAAGVTWDEADANGAWHPRTDVFAAGTGTLAYSGSTTDPTATYGTVLVPDAGVQQADTGTSALVTPDGAVANLHQRLLSGLALLPGGLVAIADFPSGVTVLDAGALRSNDVSGHVVGWVNERVLTGTVVLGDRDKDGGQELMAYAFDWGGYAASQQPAGRTSYAVDVYSHGVVLLLVSSN